MSKKTGSWHCRILSSGSSSVSKKQESQSTKKFFRPKKRKNGKHTKTLYKSQTTYCVATKRGHNLWAKKQDPDTAESALSRHRCVPKIAFRETIKPKDTTALHKTGGPPGGQPGGPRAAGFCDSLPAIPIVFADGSLRTHSLTLVGNIGNRPGTQIGKI